MRRNGYGPLLNLVEAAAVLRKDPRTVRKWITDGVRPELGIVLGGELYVRRAKLEEMIGSASDYDGVDRVTILSKGSFLSRVPPDVAHAAICAGATIPDDELSFKVYERWLTEQRDALIQPPKPEREAEIDRQLAVIDEKLQWLDEQREVVSA